MKPLTLSLFAFAYLFAGSSSLKMSKIADGVYVAFRKEPPGMMFDCNSVIIINSDDVVVIDSNISEKSALQVLDEIRKLTTKPVRFVINTHWHEDHILGNRVYRDAFPLVEFIGHRTTLTDLTTIGAANRKSLCEGAPDFVKYIEAQMAAGKSLTGKDLTEEEQISHMSDISLVNRYLAEAASFQILLPTILVDERLSLQRGEREIEVLHLGKGHTAADLVVRLPKEGILFAGDLVVWPIPLIGSTSFPAAYLQTLEKLLAIPHVLLIPGHGPAMSDDTYPRKQLELLKSLVTQTKAAKARGESLEQARKSVNLETMKALFAGNSQLRSLIFAMYVQDSGIAAAYQEP